MPALVQGSEVLQAGGHFPAQDDLGVQTNIWREGVGWQRATVPGACLRTDSPALPALASVQLGPHICRAGPESSSASSAALPKNLSACLGVGYSSLCLASGLLVLSLPGPLRPPRSPSNTAGAC